MPLGVRGSQGSADAVAQRASPHTPARPPGPHGPARVQRAQAPVPHCSLTPWWPWPGPTLLAVRSVLCCPRGACRLALPHDAAPTSVPFIPSRSCPSWCLAMCSCPHSAPRHFCNDSVCFCLRLHFLKIVLEGTSCNGNVTFNGVSGCVPPHLASRAGHGEGSAGPLSRRRALERPAWECPVGHGPACACVSARRAALLGCGLLGICF